MTTNLEQIKPELLQALKEVEGAAAQSRILLETLNGFLGDARPAPPRSR
jgi:hypothetical protein